jgi:membrane protein implicated in regulation of membrane protease activity
MGTGFIVAGTVLLAASLLTGRGWVIAVNNLVVGVEIERCGPPGGVISITLGLLLLVVWWNRRRKREKPAAAGAKSRTLRDALARRMRVHAIPVPA